MLGLEKWRRIIQLGMSVHWIDFGRLHSVRNTECHSVDIMQFSEEGATACQSRKTSTYRFGGGVNNASSPNCSEKKQPCALSGTGSSSTVPRGSPILTVMEKVKTSVGKEGVGGEGA